MSEKPPEGRMLQEQMVALVRALGLHQPDRTPCGKPVPVSEAHALLELASRDGMTAQEVAARLQLSKSTVSRLVSRLEHRGWVERARTDRDARVRLLRLTPAGRTAHEQLSVARTALYSRLLAALPDVNRGAVLDSLKLLVQAARDQH